MKISAKKALELDLRKLGDPLKALGLARFFKTGKGEYGEGDRFLGITVPAQRVVAKKYFTDLSLTDVDQLLKSPVHEVRFTALEALVMQYEHGTKADKEKVYKFYLQHATRANNWDLVDTSCHYIVGQHLLTRPRKVLYKLAKSKNIWERRIAIVSTYAFIQQGQVLDTFAISDLLKKDTHDLIHKAVGWMLREAGKQSSFALETYLASRYKNMNRTTLRYAIERFSPAVRRQYLAGTI